jgi:hypothetical protein
MLATDFYALIGIDIVMCAVFLRATEAVNRWLPVQKQNNSWPLWLSLILLAGLWIPVGDADLPLLGFARGVVSDLSTTSVALALLYVAKRIGFARSFQRQDYLVVCIFLAFTALLLYPTALGWGNWDAYRLGWRSPSLVAVISSLALIAFFRGARLLALLLAMSLIAWSVGALESGNLWDYLIDPWLACLALAVAVKSAANWIRRPV